MFGSWIDDVENIHKQYVTSSPFPNVIIPNFFDDDLAEKININFPSIDETWKHYDNPLEQKYSLNEFDNSLFSNVFAYLQADAFVDIIKKITGIDDIQKDPLLHGAGLHAYPNNGKLDVHLDYSVHPISGKERRCNLIIYMNKDWKETYGGNLELFDKNLHSQKTLLPGWNTAVLFQTSDISYHGLPKPICCPDDMYRKSLAIYYVSKKREMSETRLKAEFFPLPGQPVDPKLQRLYEIRKSRLITENDLHSWPKWRHDGSGYW